MMPNTWSNTAYMSRHESLGGRYVMRACLFGKWFDLSEPQREYMEALRLGRKHQLYKQGCEIDVVAVNPQGQWVLDSTGDWRRVV
jgi:hypothetical protein